MAEPVLTSKVEVDVRPSTQATAALDATARKLDAIQAKARSVRNLPGGPGAYGTLSLEAAALRNQGGRFVESPRSIPGLSVSRRTLANVTSARVSSGGMDDNGLRFTGSGVKLGRFGTLGSGGFAVSSQAMMKAVMPILYFSAAAHGAAGMMNTLAELVEGGRKGEMFDAGVKLAQEAGKTGFNLIGGNAVAEGIAKLDRAAGGNLMTRAEVEERDKQQAENKAKAIAESNRYGDFVQAQLIAQASTVSQGWLGRPDAYKLNQRLAATIEEAVAEARRQRRIALEATYYEQGTGF